MITTPYDILVITGPTATGKTGFAVKLASMFDSEIISADSRQVYRRMDIGTGKDLEDYIMGDKQVPYHLIDIVEPGYMYNVYEYQRDFFNVYNKLKAKDMLPVVCGGSGMYIDSIIRGYHLIQVPVNQELRKKLDEYSLEELSMKLAEYKSLHNTTDIDTKKRAVRAIEIEEHYLNHPKAEVKIPQLNSLIIGIKYDRDSRRRKISERLRKRLDSGMIEEVKALIDSGVSEDSLIYYGLEYKYITWYLQSKMRYDEMFSKLEVAIHQFAKRQMTWFRGMERKGVIIHWLDGYMPDNEKISKVLSLLKR